MDSENPSSPPTSQNKKLTITPQTFQRSLVSNVLIKVGSININGINTKLESIYFMIKKLELNILCIFYFISHLFIGSKIKYIIKIKVIS